MIAPILGVALHYVSAQTPSIWSRELTVVFDKFFDAAHYIDVRLLCCRGHIGQPWVVMAILAGGRLSAENKRHREQSLVNASASDKG